MNRSSKLFCTLIELIILVNSLTIAILLGIFLIQIGINEYAGFVVVLVVIEVLILIVERIFNNKFSDVYAFGESKLVTIISILMGIAFAAYFIWLKEYVLVALMFIIPIIINILFNKIFKKQEIIIGKKDLYKNLNI